MATILDQNFWEKLTKISESVGLKPEDLLAVMSFESGLSPAAHNRNGDASGLIQFMPDTLKGLGYKGDHNSFRQLDATDQLDYVDKYVHNQAAFSGGSFKSAAQYYVANLWPVATYGALSTPSGSPVRQIVHTPDGTHSFHKPAGRAVFDAQTVQLLGEITATYPDFPGARLPGPSLRKLRCRSSAPPSAAMRLFSSARPASHLPYSMTRKAMPS